MLFVIAAVPAWAQDAAPIPAAPADPLVETSAPPDLPIMPGTPEQALELTRWFKDASEWQKWDATYRGVAQWTWSGGVAQRRLEPPAPEWLADACSNYSDGKVTATELLVAACALQKELARNYADLIAEQITRDRNWQRTQYEDVNKSWFFSKLHIDTPYIMAQSNGWRVFSYFGVHITPFDIKKRVYVWLPPGFSLISLPRDGGRKLTPAYGAGLSFRWFDFQFPGTSQPSTMYFNLSAFLVPGSSVLPGSSNKLTMAGLSFTGRKPR